MFITGDVNTTFRRPSQVILDQLGSYGEIAGRRHQQAIASERECTYPKTVQFLPADSYQPSQKEPLHMPSERYLENLFGYCRGVIAGLTGQTGQERDYLNRSDMDKAFGVPGSYGDYLDDQHERGVLDDDADYYGMRELYDHARQQSQGLFTALDRNDDKRVDVGEYAAWVRLVDGISAYVNGMAFYPSHRKEIETSVDRQFQNYNRIMDSPTLHRTMGLDGMLSEREQLMALAVLEVALETLDTAEMFAKVRSIPQQYQTFLANQTLDV